MKLIRMQHLKEFLNSKRLPVESILSLKCTISEKIDGSAFQYYKDDTGKIIYGKRGNAPYLLSPNHLDEFDLLMDPMYYNVYNHLELYKHNIDNNIRILNFEVFSKEQDNHIIQYTGKYKNDIVLLSGYYDNGNILSDIELYELSEKLCVSCVNTIWQGYLAKNDIKTLLFYKNNDDFLWNFFSHYIGTEINKNEIEGLVLTFNSDKETRIVKVQNPIFQVNILHRLNDEKLNKESVNLEWLYDKCIELYKLNIADCSESMSKLLKLYLNITEKNNFENVEKKLGNIEILVNTKINIKLANQYYSEFGNNIKYPGILNFILYAFRNKRLKFPLWCSLEYQLNVVNEFIDNYIK